MISTVFTFIWFYLGWFGCIYLANKPNEFLCFLFPLVAFLWLFFKDKKNLQELALLLGLTLVGISFDFASLQIGVIQLHHQRIFPLWLVSLWLLYASSIPSMAKFLGSRPWLSALLGGIGGPLCYFYGKAFDLMSFTNNWSVAVYILFWSIYTPFCIKYVRSQK